MRCILECISLICVIEMAWSEDEKKVICQDGFAVVTVYLEILDKHTNRFHRMTVYMCCMNGSYRVTTLNFTTLTQ